MCCIEPNQTLKPSSYLWSPSRLMVESRFLIILSMVLMSWVDGSCLWSSKSGTMPSQFSVLSSSLFTFSSGACQLISHEYQTFYLNTNTELKTDYQERDLTFIYAWISKWFISNFHFDEFVTRVGCHNIEQMIQSIVFL